MKNIVTTTVLCLFFFQSFSQSSRKIASFLFADINFTTNDRTSMNNPVGTGGGIQAYLHNKTRFIPVIEIAGHVYPGGKKILYVTENDEPIESIGGDVTIFGGTSYTISKKTYLSFLLGPGFINGDVLPGIKPSFGFYLSKNERFKGMVSYINMFNRDKTTKRDFSSIGLAIAVKLF